MYLLVKKMDKQSRNIYRVLLIIFLTILVTYITLKTGGTKSSWPQLSFIIILLASYYWKVKGSLLVAFTLGILLGPSMPLDASGGIMQSQANWMLRMFIYLAVGFLAGYYFQKIIDTNEQLRKKDLTDTFTGLYNIFMILILRMK